jgi:hypothetical protein
MKKSSYILMAFIIGAIVFNLVGWPYQVRFNVPHLNYWAYALLCVGLPFSILMASIHTTAKTAKFIGLTASVLVALPGLFLALFASIEAIDIMERGEDLTLKAIDEATTALGTYRLYVTDCGATCSFGLLLRKEIDTPIGLKLVKPQWSAYKQHEARLVSNGLNLKVINDDKTLYEIAPK